MEQKAQVKSDEMSMAAVGRQFMRLAVENEQLRSDLQKVIEMYNNLRDENTKLQAMAYQASDKDVPGEVTPPVKKRASKE